MSFRKIRPSFGDSSASTSNPSQSTSESTGSDPRRARTGKEVDDSSTTSSKRRRVPESVTRNACLNCKKARAKCDGKKPCKRCAGRVEDSECIYEVHIKHAKEELVKQIKELRAKGHLTEQILQALSTDEKVPEIIERLRNGDTYESIVEWLGRSPTADFETLSPRGSQHSTFEATDHEMAGVDSPFRWTTVTSDTAILDHLFQLYFAWIHPVHTLFSEGHFVESYQRQSETYCSSILVNSICAIACHLHTMDDADEVDFEHLSTEFSDLVRVNIDASDTRITTTQSFAVMFLVDCARANGLRASTYLRIATDNLRSVVYHENESFQEVWKNTVRGIRNLNVEWSQMTFHVSPNITSLPFESDDDGGDELDAAKWYFYRYVNDQCPAWPGLLATTNREKAKLIDIIDDVGKMMYDQHGPKITAQDVFQQYTRYQAWHSQLPSSIGNIEQNNSQALPHVLSLLILYSNSVVQLLRPLLDLEGFPPNLVEEVIWSHTQQGLFLIDEHYRTQYTCRYQPVLQMFGLLHLTDVLVRFFSQGSEGSSKDGPGAVQLGLEVLMESRAGFPVAGPLQEMLRRCANNCHVRLPKNIAQLMESPRKTQAYTIDDLIDACTRPTFLQPVAEIHKRYIRSFTDDWATDGGFLEPISSDRILRVPSAEERGAQSLMRIRNLLNTN